MRRLAGPILVLTVACSSVTPGPLTPDGAMEGEPPDSGTDAGTSGQTDAGKEDAGVLDGGPSDGGATDAGGADAGGADAGGADAGTTDSGSPDAGPGTDAGVCALCLQFKPAQNQGPLPTQLVETSGIVASRDHPGVLYAHNDSGDSARVFAVSSLGTLIATLSLTDGGPGMPTHEDYEDIALGPCPTGSCVYVGDIGDNGHSRLTKTVYRFREPVLAPGMSLGTRFAGPVEAFPFVYPGLFAFPNAETMMVHPISGVIYVVTKEDSGTPSSVYKFPMPLTPGVIATLIKVTTMVIPSGNDPDISGGDIHPCGSAVLFRVSNAHVYQLTVPAGQPFDSVFSLPLGSILDLPKAAEGNAEAISWSADGRGYFTVSEGSGAMLHYFGCL